MKLRVRHEATHDAITQAAVKYDIIHMITSIIVTNCLQGGALDNACGCKLRWYIGESHRNGMLAAIGIGLVETVRFIGSDSEDAFGGQRRHGELHGPDVKSAAAAAVGALALRLEIPFHAPLQTLHDDGDEGAGTLHAFTNGAKSSN